MQKQEKLYTLQGGAGEAAVAAQLMLRNVVPYLPMVDVGVDMMTDTGCRIQVKSARLCKTPQTLRKNLDGVYRFGFQQKYYRSIRQSDGSTKSQHAPRRRFEEYCDVVVLWGIEQNRFWVVPSKLIGGLHGVDLGQDNERAFSKDVPEMREMVSLGYSHAEIAKHFNISPASVCIRLKRAGTKVHLSAVTTAIRACENAWHHIIDFGQPAAIELQAPTLVVEKE